MFRLINKKWILPALVLPALILLSPGIPVAAENSGQVYAGRSVRIMILSKSLRELKEERSQPLVLDFSAGTCAQTEKGTFSLTGLAVRFIDGRYIVTCGGNELGSGRTVITGDGSDSLFKITARGETRRYPLPLEIKCTGSDVQFTVTENIMQYAVDSAYAELGVYEEKKTEALFALAHAVLARSLAVKEGTKHGGAHFCDLTCCQSYRGRSAFTFDDQVTISAECGGRIFFGSSGGGVIMTGRVFSTDPVFNEQPQPDFIYSENFTLSRELYPSWSARISSDELNTILFAAIKKKTTQINYSVQNEAMTLSTYEGPFRIAPETFRLIINRVKGWAFIKSNNYKVRSDNGFFVFSGSGLGHCAGLSIEGAVQLAGKGYSRYEILEHYYPWIKYNLPGEDKSYFYNRYVTFDMEHGINADSPAMELFLSRRMPIGSVSKLVTVLYLASERKDLLYNHRFRCGAVKSGRDLPEKCWEPGGHGSMDLRSAIYNSCNLYFASLYSVIDMNKYLAWVKIFTQETGTNIDIPSPGSEREFALLLAGLDFRATVSVRGLVKLAMLVSPCDQSDGRIAAFRKKIGADELGVIRNALCSTMILGTGSHCGENGNARLEEYKRISAWGKTGTVISGTNSHCGYGIFIGGYGRFGIVSVLRKGTGSMAADYSGNVLISMSKKVRNNDKLF